MTHKKWHEEIDWMKYIPIVVMAVAFVAGYTTLKNNVASAQNDLLDQKTWLVKQNQDNTQIKISQARSEEKINAIYDAIKDLRRA